MTINIPNYFKRYAWTYEQVDSQIWLSTFSSEFEDEFDLYVSLGDEWVHFAVSPFLPRPEASQQAYIYAILLRLNQQMRLVHFAVDEDGDINLLVELPVHSFVYAHFVAAMDALVYSAQTLARDLGRMVQDPKFRSPLIPMA